MKQMEYYNGEICVGGKVTARQWGRMCEIEESLESFVPAVPGRMATDCHEVSLDPDQPLYLFDGEAAGGEFSQLEEYLIEQGIPFDRHSDAGGGYDAEERSFRPGMEPLTAIASNDGEIMASASEVLGYLTRRLTLEQIPSPDDGGDTGLALLLMRRSHTLPAFQFVEAE